ncbi:MAG: indole-3-glycerol phosphate synthase [Verrucomicrobiota bacterium]|jgi:indole-3-glycerol phosphate synthase
MSRLDEILAVKRREVEQLRPRAAELHRQAVLRNDFRSLRAALKREDGKLSIIAEVKKASPSAGIIAESFDPVEIARGYEQNGASAISVLTDAQFFHGALDHLVDVRAEVALPVLRKDFVIDEIQISEASANRADAILLIVAALTQKELVDLSEAAVKYQLDALVEVHTLEEMDRAADAGAQIIGINNRDLTTFHVDLSVTERLSEDAPNDIVLVSESGIKTREDVARIKACGINAVLVGEALMRGELSIKQIRAA